MSRAVSRRSVVSGALAHAFLGPANAATVDPDGMLRIDGTRKFVLGLYQPPNGRDGLQAAADAGFRVIQGQADRGFLDRAHAHGLRCWVATGSDPDRIRKIVAEIGKHPAVLFWETEDEPSWQWKKPGPRVSAERIRAAYALLKQLDPGRLVYLNHAPTNLISTLRSYNPGGDILATDIYPVIPHGIRELYGLWPTGRQGDLADTHISQVGRYADKIRAVAGPSRATFLVQQAFAWENLREKDPDAVMVIYPTRAQLRFMAWQAVVHGTNGILWWGLSSNPVDAPVWADLTAVVKEMREHDGALSAHAAKLRLRLTYYDTGHSLDRGIEWIAKPAGNGYLLVVVNADPNPVDVALEGDGVFSNAEAVSGGNILRNNKGKLRIRLVPFDVGLFRVLPDRSRKS
jgi:hypothetical protein